MEALLVAVFGGAAVLAVSGAVWFPLRARESIVHRRIERFVDAVADLPPVVDFSGRARRRSATTANGQQGRILRALERRLASAKLDLAPQELLIGMLVAATIALVAGWLFFELVGGIVAAAAVPAVVLGWLSRRASGIQNRFTAQLPDTVALLATSVRTGHSVLQALEHVSREAPEPTRSAFALTVREIGLGASLEDALARLVERYPSEDMDLISSSVNIHSSVGGSLVRILDTVTETIRERNRMAGEVKALTSQQRYSAYVLALLPVFILIGLKLISPDYANELFKPSLRIALIGAAALVVTGFLIMQRMASIDD
jgi:tight adherence protein B